MDRDKIIILALIVIIAALLVSVVAMMPNTKKLDTKLTFKSNATLTEGDSLKIQLTDVNGTAISNQTVNVTITDKDKSNSYYSVLTNDDGIAKLKLDKSAGEYKVTISYGGNENYTGSNTTQNLTIKEEVKETVSQESSSSSSSSDAGGYDKYSPQYGTYVKQYTDSNGVQHIDGANGMHESYDPSTGLFTHEDGNGRVSSEYR